jgi:hypothetical protein
MVWCWWCCHPIENGADIGMPMRYDPVKKSFETYGYFCGPACIRSYNHNEPMAKKANQTMLISMYINDTCDYAPPRQMLDKFGGTMTIEEFRAQGNTTYHLQLPSSVRVNHTIDAKNKSNYKWIKSANDNGNKTYSMKDFEEHASAKRVENNAIKIKPSQTTKKKQMNTLEMVLGLVPNTN